LWSTQLSDGPSTHQKEESKNAPPTDPQRYERQFLALWRWIAIGVDTFLIAFTVLVDNLGRLFLDPTFHVSEVLFGALVTSWLVLLGFEGRSLLDRWRGPTNGR
jgi:hypothetical protein